MVFLQGKVNGARYIAQVVNSVLLPFLPQEGEMLLQQKNAHPHTAAAMKRSLRGVEQLPWPARITDLSPIEHVWDMMKRDHSLSPEPATTIAELRQGVQNSWDNLSQDDIRHFMTVCIREYTPGFPPEGATLCIDVTVWAPLIVTCASFDLNLLSYTPK